MGEPRVLLLDIETTPNQVYSWGLKVDGYLDHANIVKERHILCAAWKWLGESEVHSETANLKKRQPDRRILRALQKALEKADAVVAHNGDKFDLPWLMARFVICGFPPPKPCVQIDTCKIARDKFYFNTNRLDYLGKILKVGRKIHTGFDLWKKAMVGDAAAMKSMVAYNKQDVLLLERVYMKLRPYVVAKLNRALFKTRFPAQDRTCPACGAEELAHRGTNYTRTSLRIALKCRSCGHWCYKVGPLPR